MQVTLGGLDIKMAQQFLNVPDICTTVQQVRGKTVPRKATSC